MRVRATGSSPPPCPLSTTSNPTCRAGQSQNDHFRPGLVGPIGLSLHPEYLDDLPIVLPDDSRQRIKHQLQHVVDVPGLVRSEVERCAQRKQSKRINEEFTVRQARDGFDLLLVRPGLARCVYGARPSAPARPTFRRRVPRDSQGEHHVIRRAVKWASQQRSGYIAPGCRCAAFGKSRERLSSGWPALDASLQCASFSASDPHGASVAAVADALVGSGSVPSSSQCVKRVRKRRWKMED